MTTAPVLPEAPEVFIRKLQEYRFMQKLMKLPAVDEIILFGSRARGTARLRSDIDLAIRLSDWANRLLEWEKIEDILEHADTLLPIDAVRLSSSTPKALLENIQEEGVVVYRRALD